MVVRSDACYILALASPLNLNLDVVFSKAPISQIAGSPVWSWEVNDSESDSPWTFFIIQIRKTDVFIATNLEHLISVISHVVEHPTRREILSQLPEWKEVDRKHRIWAVRRYRREETRDPMSAGLSLGGDVFLDHRAVALTFSFDPQSNVVRIRYLTSGENEGPLQNLKRPGEIVIKRIRAGLWEGSFVIVDSDTTRDQLHTLLGMFGFGIHL